MRVLDDNPQEFSMENSFFLSCVTTQQLLYFRQKKFIIIVLRMSMTRDVLK